MTGDQPTLSTETRLSLPDGREFAAFSHTTLQEVPPPEPPGALETRTAWTSDFATVRRNGTIYTFTPKQRLVVAALLQAEHAGTPFIGQAELLEIAEASGQRLRDLFRKSEAWGTLIVQGHMQGGPLGTYTLTPERRDT